MSIWTKFRARRRSEAKGLADPQPGEFAMYGLTPGAVSSAEALAVPAVQSAVRVISEAAAGLDLSIRRRAATGTETPVDHPALPLLRDHANDWTSGFELLRDLVIDALTDNAGGLVWVNRVADRPVELIRYRSGVVNVDYNQNTGEPRYRLFNRPVAGADMIHLRSPFGRSCLSLAAEGIAVARALDQHAGRLFTRGARPSGVLSFPKGMGEESVKKARAAWRATHEGEDAGGQTAILYDGAEFQPLTLTSTDAQFIENRRFQILEIARAFRVPPTMLFELERATWSNTEQMGREFLIYCLEPWLRALEGALSRALLTPAERAAGLVVRFDRDDLTRADLTTRATAINSLIAARVLNPNEGREWLGMPPYAGGEDFANPNITTATEGAEDGPDRDPVER